MKSLYFGDCLDVLKELNTKYPEGFIDLIYIDPPFNSKRNYNILFEDMDLNDTKAQREAFADTWSNVSYLDTLGELADLNFNLYDFLKTLDKINISKSAVAYLTTMAVRIYYMHKVLKETGSFYLHCDPNMSHYLKLICDVIFGKDNFRNEVIWCYKEREGSKKNWNKKHDVILFYSKSKNYTFNWKEVYEEYSPGTIKKFNYTDDTGRKFQIRGKGGNYTGKQGLNIELEKTNPDLVYRDYLDKSPGVPPRDWFIIPVLNRASSERLGYPTQKPEALLERIIKASSNEGDLVADFFCGCGTTIAAANKLNRQWLGVDISHLAIKLILKRLTAPIPEEGRKKFLKEIEIHGFPKDIDSAKQLAKSDELLKKKSKHGAFDFQHWVVEFLLGGVRNPLVVADGGWDGYITFPKNDKDKGRMLIEVKSGKVSVKNIREFINVINREKADFGVFVCFAEQVTKPMELAAKQDGKYKPYDFDRIQILTIEDIFEGKEIKIPAGVAPSTFKQSTKDVRSINQQDKMFD